MIAVVTGLVLLGGTVFGSAPAVFADDDDHEEKIKKLKDLINKWKKDKKCPEKKKYDGVCDKKKPKIDITSPTKKQQVPGSTVMITGVAKDNESGIDRVHVKVVGGPSGDADYDPITGEWKFTAELTNGWKFVIATAYDKVDNKKRDFVFFKVV